MTTTATDAPANGRARKLRRGPLTRKQILDASLRLFSEKGFTRASVRDIAQAAGITDAAIYYHFESKRELFEALIEERGFTSALKDLEGAQTEHLTIEPLEAISSIAIGALALMYANRDLMKVLLVEAMAEDPVAMEEYGTLVRRWTKAEARILKHYIQLDMIQTEDADELAKQLVIAVVGAFSDFIMSPAEAPSDHVPDDLRRHIEIAMRHIVHGIAGQA
ncbi:MAG: TetR/AcrR family transcriptional regulator [Dehalococcoidia bacterium]|nr:TetR/AcrR family transcriptional regulator [Dehalococcoidia bacterium]